MLKSIEIGGFKSFAKKSTLVFSSPITAIVGPNGSGKSNTAEAFRFVLGEQSKKRMRTAKSEDLLWMGTESVSRANHARVAITFDNHPGKNGKRLLDIDFDEVLIERSVFRDGENEYRINGSKVRLKDVSALLAGAHIGASGHHIISQGEADRILGATAKERKEMLEEALGLNVYKYKKIESERKLEKTLENIKDAESLKRELAPHLKFLNRQMQKLERSRELSEKLRAMYSTYIQNERTCIQQEEARLTKDEQQPKAELAEVSARIQTLREEIKEGSTASKEEDALSAADEEVATLLQKKGELERELGRLEGQADFARREARRRAQEAPKSVSVSSVRAFIGQLESVFKGEDIKEILAQARAIIAEFSSDTLASGSEQEAQETQEHTQEIENQLAEKQKSIQELEETLKSKKETQKTLREALRKKSVAEGDRAQVLYELKTKEDELQNIVREIARARDALSFAKNELERVEADARHLGVVAPEQNASAEGSGAPKRQEQRDALKEIERTHARLEEAGTVDEDTVREHKDVEERVAFLDREIVDLKQSRVQLLELIEDLDEEIEERFKRGLAKIDTEFGKFFALLFDGGSANVKSVQIKKRSRSDEAVSAEGSDAPMEEIYESGIEVSVKLPRKKVSSLDVLSGGERALTSIALIFAMSQVNPPPFIILDETDAALDEANSRRYADMVRALSEHSQLILVTHNRQTMQAAGELYGVTMSGDGVSKLLSVKFDEAVAVAK